MGTVYFEGDLRPGNSPNVVEFEGSVAIGQNALTVIELEGLNEGEFDKLDIAGDLALAGDLQVDFLNGYTLTGNDQFIIAEVDGVLSGVFANFAEGDIVANDGNLDLFISYQGGDGNDVMLFTAVPEPSAAIILGLVGLAAVMRRRRRSAK